MQLVDRVFMALEILSGQNNGLSVSELASKLDIPISSTHRVLKSLQDHNYIEQDMITKRYRLGYKIFSLCAGMKENDSLIRIVRPYMEQLAEEISKPIVLCVMVGNHIMNLDCVECVDSSIYLVKTGKELPIHATSAGRIFVAHMPDEKIHEIVKSMSLSRETPFTITSQEELLQEIYKFKKQGYSVIDEELQIGIQGISSPIYDSNHKVIATIGMTTLKSENAINESMINTIKEYAEKITKAIQ